MNVNLKEKIAQIYARNREAPARWRIPLLFLALLVISRRSAATRCGSRSTGCGLRTDYRCVFGRGRARCYPRRRGFGLRP